MIQKNILVLLAKVPADTEIYAKLGIGRYCQKVSDRTNGEFKILIDYAETDANFHTLPGNNTDGAQIVYIDPNEIALEGHKIELAHNKEYDTVCLIAGPMAIIGAQPTNPAEDPVTLNGFNPIQIPAGWIGNSAPAPTQLPWEGSQFSAQLFFAHENSHSDFYIINSEAGLALRDKTHDPNPYQALTATLDPSDYFIDLLLELKPYWSKLGNSGGPAAPQGDPMVFFKVKGKPALYEFVNSGWRGYADPEPYASDTTGHEVKIVELGQAEFDKLPQLSPVKK